MNSIAYTLVDLYTSNPSKPLKLVKVGEGYKGQKVRSRFRFRWLSYVNNHPMRTLHTSTHISLNLTTNNNKTYKNDNLFNTTLLFNNGRPTGMFS